MVIEACAFRTERLVIDEWHRVTDDAALARIVATMLTPRVTHSLPRGWQGPYDTDRAQRWIAERDAEATTLLVSEPAARSPVGLVLLHEGSAAGSLGLEVRLGYLLSERAWGRGLGGELVNGFVGWAREQPTVDSVVGGVAPGNVPSIRILERNGFVRLDRDDDPGGELEYRLALVRST